MPRTVFLFVLVCLVGLTAAGCGPSRMLPGRAGDADSTPTVEAFPTFTPTIAALSTPADVPASASTPSSTETDAETSAETSAETGAETDAETDATSRGAQAEGGENASAGEASTPEPTDGGGFLLPTATAEPSESAPSPAAETDSPAAEADSAQLSVAVASVNVRGGPGTDYEAIGVAAEGERFPLVGRNEQGDWWQVCCFEDQPGWLYGPLVEVENADDVALAADIPPAPVSVPTPVPQVVQEQEPEPEPQPVAQEEAPASPDVAADAGTAGNFDPNAQYQIVHYRVLGFDDNNGGIFNKGGQHLIFVTVLDQNGNGVDGAVVKDAVGDKLNVSVGTKGPGKAEIKMDWDPYKLYVSADPSGEVTSQVSNQMNNPYPHIPDVVGMLGPADNEYAICPTVDDRCDPPFYHAHWSYEITFQKVR